MNNADTLMQFEAAQTQPAPWPELPEETLPVFPTDLLPGFCGELAEAVAASLPVPVDYAVGAMLGAVSAALVGRVIVQPRLGHNEAIQLYLCIGGESGTNKSRPMKVFIEPLEKWLSAQRKEVLRRNRDRDAQREMLDRRTKKTNITEGELASLRQRMEQVVNEPEPETIITDTTPEKLAHRMAAQGGKGIIFTDEGSLINILAGSTYGGQGSSANLDTVLKGFDGASIMVDRMSAPTIDIERANLTITIGMQPGLIARMTGSADLIDRGFPQRALFFLPQIPSGRDLLHLPDYPQELLARWDSLLTSLACVHRDQPLIMPMTADALRTYNLHRQDMENRVSEDMGDNDAIRAWAHKAHGKTARLAGIMAKLENPQALIIEDRHVRAAVTMMNLYFVPHAKRAFVRSGVLSAASMDLWQIMREWESFREAELKQKIRGQKRFKGTQGEKLFRCVLEELQASGFIRLKREERSEGRGRPFSPAWEVNPGGRSS